MRKSSKKVFISQHPSASARKGRGAGGTTCSWGRTWVTGSPHLGTAPTSAQRPPRHSAHLSTAPSSAQPRPFHGTAAPTHYSAPLHAQHGLTAPVGRHSDGGLSSVLPHLAACRGANATSHPKALHQQHDDTTQPERSPGL